MFRLSKRSAGAVAVLMLQLFWSAGNAPADESNGTPAAKTHFDKGESARKSGDLSKAAEEFRQAIEIDPDYVEAHSSYIFTRKLAASRSGDMREPAPEDPKARAEWQKEQDKRQAERSEKIEKEITALYEGWTTQNPNKAAFVWALGSMYDYKDPARAEKYYRKAIELDPRFARAYMALSLKAEFRGDENASREYLKKAAETNPGDPQYLFYYAQKLREDRALYRRTTEELVKKFPSHERGAQGLYWLAETSDDPAEKVAVLERLRASFPPEKFSWSESGMSNLYEAYSKTDPDKALGFANEMTRLFPRDKNWQTIATCQRNLVWARTLIGEEHASVACALLDVTTAPRYPESNQLPLLKAEALDRSGDTAEAYDSLVKLVAKGPDAELNAALLKYAAKLKKDSSQAESDIWELRDQAAKPGKEIGLPLYSEDRRITLADMKGKVFLLNFWYPG